LNQNAVLKFPDPVENFLDRFRRKSDDNAAVVMRLKAEVERLKNDQKNAEGEILRTTFEKFFSEASSPLSQLILQNHLSQSANSDLGAADILPHVKRLIETFEAHGLTVNGQPDEIQRFDPNLHEPVRPDFRPEPQTPVRIRFPGFSFAQTPIRKAAVDSAEME
jgi:molecular chaperone GrpE (heat shock protein)